MTNKNFTLLARFYKNSQDECCREYLDIKDESCVLLNPELIVLMLNPGSCGELEDLMYYEDVPVNADATLHRVKDLMNNSPLNWVRVLNLTDLQEKSGEDFFERLGTIDRDQIPEHSIFHSERENDLMQLVKARTPFLIALGEDQRKEALATAALERIKSLGYPIISETGLYNYPLARTNDKIPCGPVLAFER